MAPKKRVRGKKAAVARKRGPGRPPGKKNRPKD